ncbi:hypothetical protein ACLMJK_001063 [Lecanora helva]
MSQESQGIEPREIALDQSITGKLSYNARIVKASDQALNHATRIIKFHTREPALQAYQSGFYQIYFLKLRSGPTGHDIVRGEYNSMKALSDVVPYLVPKPVAWGTLHQNQNLHFFITHFIDLDQQVINTRRLAAALADLHRRSVAPGAKFGFHVSTFVGHIAQNNRRTDTWEEYFSNDFLQLLDMYKSLHGPFDASTTKLSLLMVLKVIPRLLRPMEANGHSITPVLLHGNLTLSNAYTSLKTHGPIIYSASALYGHHEYDIRNLVLGKNGAEFLEAYEKLVPASEPKEDFEDRVALYGLKSLMHESCLHPKNKESAQDVVERMKTLVDKFPEGYEANADEGGKCKAAQKRDGVVDEN